jgi:Amidohydrolase
MHKSFQFIGSLICLTSVCCALAATAVAQTSSSTKPELPLFDAHIHYSHDAVETVPVAKVLELMRQAGVKKAMVSSSNDDGTQKLLAAAPDLIVPSLRPYRLRSDLSTWTRDTAILAHVEDRLKRYRYAAIGEFHLYGAEADLPIPRRIVQLAKDNGIILHAHSDVTAVDKIFAQNPKALVLWAHSGFENPAVVGQMLAKYPKLWADLAYRSDMSSTTAAGMVLDESWRAVFMQFPDRFMVGTDTFTPERLYYIPEHAANVRRWLALLPDAVARKIAMDNALEMLAQTQFVASTKTSSTTRTGKSSNLTVTVTEPDAATMKNGQFFEVKVRVDPDLITSVAATSLTATGSLKFDAWMPDHRHGMNYKPKIEQTASNEWRVSGLLFHMPGKWQYRIAATSGTVTDSIHIDTVIQ